MLPLNKSKNNNSHFANFEQVIKFKSCFADFEQVFFFPFSFFFLNAYASSFLIHLPFPNSQSAYLWLPTPHCAAPVWLTGRYAMPLVTRYFPPNLLSRGAEDFLRGDNHSKHMPLLTYLDPKLVFKHVKAENAIYITNLLWS